AVVLYRFSVLGPDPAVSEPLQRHKPRRLRLQARLEPAGLRPAIQPQHEPPSDLADITEQQTCALRRPHTALPVRRLGTLFEFGRRIRPQVIRGDNAAWDTR